MTSSITSSFVPGVFQPQVERARAPNLIGALENSLAPYFPEHPAGGWELAHVAAPHANPHATDHRLASAAAESLEQARSAMQSAAELADNVGHLLGMIAKAMSDDFGRSSAEMSSAFQAAVSRANPHDDESVAADPRVAAPIMAAYMLTETLDVHRNRNPGGAGRSMEPTHREQALLHSIDRLENAMESFYRAAMSCEGGGATRGVCRAECCRRVP